MNVSFTHLLGEPGPGGVSGGYLRRGTVVRIIERRSIINQNSLESWVLVEGNYPEVVDSREAGSAVQGWIQERMVEIYDSESQANTASKAMSQ